MICARDISRSFHSPCTLRQGYWRSENRTRSLSRPSISQPFAMAPRQRCAVTYLGPRSSKAMIARSQGSCNPSIGGILHVKVRTYLSLNFTLSVQPCGSLKSGSMRCRLASGLSLSRRWERDEADPRSPTDGQPPVNSHGSERGAERRSKAQRCKSLLTRASQSLLAPANSSSWHRAPRTRGLVPVCTCSQVSGAPLEAC